MLRVLLREAGRCDVCANRISTMLQTEICKMARDEREAASGEAN